MGPRNLLILFFSTVAVSLVILIIFFSLFFKNVDLNFNTRLPESAPDIGRQYANNSPSMNPESKADGLMRSTVNVPPEMREPEPAPATKKKIDDNLPDSELPPVSDDIMLERDLPTPAQTERSTLPEATEIAPVDRTTRSDQLTTPPPAPRNPRPIRRQGEPQPEVAPIQTPAPVQEAVPSGPPVPGQ